ncbi:MAG: hypothetical protein NkDv07_0752 [Candidatus Improbicoccus devescovinae]|nr:MAG: hypothetical protein NkDv07_0752 [Candidatus Improbicoccus devescovinae]
MNHFLKNNKIILCIICFVLINTPAQASTTPEGLKTPETYSEDTDPFDNLEELQTNFRSQKRHSTDRFEHEINEIYQTQNAIDPGDQSNMARLIKRTGLYFHVIDGMTVAVVINRNITASFFGVKKSTINGHLRKLSMYRFTSKNKLDILRGLPAYVKGILNKNQQWTVRHAPTILGCSSAGIGASEREQSNEEDSRLEPAPPGTDEGYTYGDRATPGPLPGKDDDLAFVGIAALSTAHSIDWQPGSPAAAAPPPEQREPGNSSSPPRSYKLFDNAGAETGQIAADAWYSPETNQNPSSAAPPIDPLMWDFL